MGKLIGVTGRALAGKDTFAKGLLVRGFVRAALADPLKDITAHIADEPVALYHDVVTKEQFSEGLGMTRRAGLQKMGTEGVRNVLGPDVWVRRLVRRWECAGRPNTVITDVRFDNEADMIIAAGGFILRIERGGSGLSGDAAKHSSEAGVSDDRILCTLVNDGTVEKLQAEAADFADVEYGPGHGV